MLNINLKILAYRDLKREVQRTFALNSCLSEIKMLLDQFGILVNSHKRAASQLKIFDHKLAKTILGVVHLIVKDECQTEALFNERH